MTIQQTYQILQSTNKLNLIIMFFIVLFICANVILDFSFTLFNNSSFFLSESLLFSSYWLLFLPLLMFAFTSCKPTEKLKIKLLLVSCATVIHLFLYPGFVWLLSKIFYNHTFNYWQTFNFGLSAYFIKTILIYGFSILNYTFLSKKNQPSKIENEAKQKTEKKVFIGSILVTDSNFKKLILQVDDILYFSANSPYINIYHSSKKYLHTETLKSLEMQLNNEQFVRIHKSFIVNITKISTLQSRQNGDYDITLIDNTILRVSRNYARNFKSAFEYTHLTIK